MNSDLAAIVRILARIAIEEELAAADEPTADAEKDCGDAE